MSVTITSALHKPRTSQVREKRGIRVRKLRPSVFFSQQATTIDTSYFQKAE
jgi:hypothetical protein